jgi:hypothetical protein
MNCSGKKKRPVASACHASRVLSRVPVGGGPARCELRKGKGKREQKREAKARAQHITFKQHLCTPCIS